jgi:hypothetical protein
MARPQGRVLRNSTNFILGGKGGHGSAFPTGRANDAPVPADLFPSFQFTQM